MLDEVLKCAPIILEMLSIRRRGDLTKPVPAIMHSDTESVMSLRTLVKGQSVRTLVVQLFISFMLTARSTSN